MAAPPLFMALLLTTRPLQSLGLRRPSWRFLAGAAALAVLLLLPLVDLTEFVLGLFPGIKELIRQYHPLTEALDGLRTAPAEPMPACSGLWPRICCFWVCCRRCARS